MAEIAPDPPGWLTALRFDIDTEGGGAAWIEAELPAPNLVIVNPRNGHAHLVYLLGAWVQTDCSDPRRLKVVRYAAAIERAYNAALGADPAYTGRFHHNPLSDAYVTKIGRDAPYSLDELARYVDLYEPALKKNPPIGIGRNVETFVAALIDGKTLRGIEAIGKHLLYDFGLDRFLHVHLGRFGNFEDGPMPLPEPRGVLRFRLYTAKHWFELRGAIAIEMFDASMRQLLETRIGPSPLDEAADPLIAYGKIVTSRAPIGMLLMDQSVVAGIGNIYRSEILFLHRLHPRTPGSALTKQTWRALWKDLGTLMRDATLSGRIVTTAARDREKPSEAVRRSDRFYVYRRDGLPCRWCGTPVVTGTLGNRNVFWCSRDQVETNSAL